MLNNLEKIVEEVEKTFKPLPAPTGTRDEKLRELLRRFDEREIKLKEEAIRAEREGDHDGTWLCMAARAENARGRAKILSSLNKTGDQRADARG
jgi:hypothetical protein